MIRERVQLRDRCQWFFSGKCSFAEVLQEVLFISFCSLGLLLFSIPVEAQTTTGTGTPTPTPTPTVGTGAFSVLVDPTGSRDFQAVPFSLADCQAIAAGNPTPIRVQWTLPAGTLPGATISVFPYNSVSCPTTAPASPTCSLTIVEQPFCPNDAVNASELSTADLLKINSTNLSSSQPTTNPCPQPYSTGNGIENTNYAICILVNDNNGANPIAGYLPIRMDTQAPVAVTDITVGGGDSSIILSWTTSDTDIASYQIVATALDANGKTTSKVITNNVTASSSGPGTSKETLQGLVNGTKYQIIITATDTAGNVGEASAPLVAQPQPECDFWNCYRGKEPGGFCFISTAAYGSYDSSFVQVFRDVRDLILLKFAWGRSFVVWYYKHGVGPARWLAHHPIAKAAVSILLLLPFIAAYPSVRFGVGPIFLFAMMGVAIFVVLLRFHRRRIRQRALGSLLIFMTACCFSLPIYAKNTVTDDDDFQPDPTEKVDDLSDDGPARFVTEHGRPRLGVNLKFGPYAPNIDSDPAANHQYSAFFGPTNRLVSSGNKLRIDGQLDIYFLRQVGLLGVSGGFGYWQANAPTKKCLIDNQPQEDCGDLSHPFPGEVITKGVGSTQFTIFPMNLSLVYKFDFFNEHYKVPLVPFVYAGLDVYFWTIQGSGRTAVRRDLNTKGSGATYGYHVNPGLAIGLDWIDPSSARRAFETVGMDGVYLTFEWIFNRINYKFKKPSWDLSDSNFQLGLSVNFK